MISYFCQLNLLGLIMAKLSLNGLTDIDGFIAAALVDSESGLAMATQGNNDIDLELAAAGNTEVVRSKRKVAKALNLNDSIEDILILLEANFPLCCFKLFCIVDFDQRLKHVPCTAHLLLHRLEQYLKFHYYAFCEYSFQAHLNKIGRFHSPLTGFDG